MGTIVVAEAVSVSSGVTPKGVIFAGASARRGVCGQGTPGYRSGVIVVGRARRYAVAALVSSLGAGLLTGCAPQAPDHSSWTDQAHVALQDVSSEVATVTLLLRLEQQRKVPGKYQQVVAQDSESAVGATMAKFGGEQPEPRDDDVYKRVTSLMSDASDLLSQVRIAIVRRDEAAYPDLLRQLEGLQENLTRAEDRL